MNPSNMRGKMCRKAAIDWPDRKQHLLTLVVEEQQRCIGGMQLGLHSGVLDTASPLTEYGTARYMTLSLPTEYS